MRKSFSLPLFLVLVFALSWPFQFWYVFKAETAFSKYLFSSLSMIMVSVATFVFGRLLFKERFTPAGWNWGKPVHYLFVFLFALFVWLVPSLIELITGIHRPEKVVSAVNVLMMFSLWFTATLLPAFGEEFAWRGYMLPRLAEKYGAKKGLLIHAIIWWFWHLPVLIGMGMHIKIAGSDPLVNVFVICFFSIIPSMMHAVIFAFIWSKTKSLAVVTVYHAAFDEVRDTLEEDIGFGPLVNNWQMIVITIVGGYLLWKVNWEELLSNKNRENKYKLNAFQ